MLYRPLFFLFALYFLSGCYQTQIEQDLVAIQIQDRNGLTETINAPDRLEKYEQIDFLSSHPYKKVLRAFKKEGKNLAKITTYHPNGSIWQYLEAEELRAQGAYREWYPNGKQKLEAFVIGGTADVSPGAQQDWLFDGLSQVWDEDGNLKARIPYEKGSIEGISIYYYPSGILEKEIPHKKNVVEGFALSYFPNGWVKEKTGYLKGTKEGLSLGYFSKGEPAWIEEYSAGLLVKGAYYAPDGSQLTDVEDGRGFQVVYEDELPVFFVEIQRGRTEGLVKRFSPSGELLGCYFVKNGMRHGEEISYYPNPDKTKPPSQKLSLQWNQDVVHGLVKTWYENGQLESQKEYSRNQLSGPACAWYNDGGLMFVEEYEEGKLVKGLYYRKGKSDPASTIVGGNGVATLFDGDGVFLRKVAYAKGKAIDPED